MAEDTGRMMNTAIQQGCWEGLGAGESLGRMIAENDTFHHRSQSLLYNSYRIGIPYTIHIAIGTDIIHQHPNADFSAIGWATGQDFKILPSSPTNSTKIRVWMLMNDVGTNCDMYGIGNPNSIGIVK